MAAMGDRSSAGRISALFLIGAIFISIILISGCPIVPPTPPNGNGTPGNVTPPVINVTNATNVSTGPCEQTSVFDRDRCYKSLAQQNSDLSYCSKIYQLPEKDACLYLFAGTGQEVCALMSVGSPSRDQCFDLNARVQKKMDICDRIGNETLKAQCIEAVAPPCSLIDDDAKRELCLALDGKDYNLCRSDSCFYGYALDKNAEAPCRNISQDSTRLACLTITKDVDECKNGLYEAVRDMCYMLASDAENYPVYCEKISEFGTYREDCYLGLALKNGDGFICNKDRVESERNTCYLNYSLATGNAIICLNITGPMTRTACSLQTAVKYNKPQYCQFVVNLYDATACYSLILNSGNAILLSDCDQIPDSSWQDVCYSRVALQQNDKSLCDRISGKDVKQNCYAKFG